MLFFGLFVVVALLAYPVSSNWPQRMRYAMAAALFLIGAFRKAAGALLAVYFVAVFPANIHNALSGLAVDGLPQAAWYYWLRLPFQPLAVWWALYSAGLIQWPFRRRPPRQTPARACGAAPEGSAAPASAPRR